MKRHILLAMITALALALFGASWASAAVSGQVIVASDRTTGTRVELPATGGIPAQLRYGGDLTYGGAPRYFLYLQPNGTNPDRTPHYDLWVWDENGTAGSLLYANPGQGISGAWWSPDNTRVAFEAVTFGSDGKAVEQGIYVGEVNGSLGASPSLTDVYLRVPFTSEMPTLSWAGDSQHVAYALTLFNSQTHDLVVANVDTGERWRITQTDRVDEVSPAFSPVTTTDAAGKRHARLAYVTKTSGGGPYRNDIFVLDVVFDPCAALTTAVQVTNVNNANLMQISHPAWSPNGVSLAFDAYTKSGSQQDLYRIPADGSSKAVNLTSAPSASDAYAVPIWRA